MWARNKECVGYSDSAGKLKVLHVDFHSIRKSEKGKVIIYIHTYAYKYIFGVCIDKRKEQYVIIILTNEYMFFLPKLVRCKMFLRFWNCNGNTE